MPEAVARALALRMTAERDGFAVGVATIGIPAIAGFQLYQRQMARHDLDAAEFDADRRVGERFGSGSAAARVFANFWSRGGFNSCGDLGSASAGPGTDESHPFGATERGIAGIGRVEPAR